MVKEKDQKEKPRPEEKQKPEDKKGAKDRRIQIVRVSGRDLDGAMHAKRAIAKIRGVSHNMANAVSEVSGLGDKKVSELTEAEIKKIEHMVANPIEYGIPAWMCNRRADPQEGTDKHIVSATLELTHKMDINELKKTKSYRGIRHIYGLPVRGQRTRSSFRKSATVGVSRSKAKAAKSGGAKK